MKTTGLVCSLLLLTTLSFAQKADDSVGESQKSKTTGFYLGASINGGSQAFEDSDTDDIESGSGFGLTIGYGFNGNIQAFLNADITNLDTELTDSDVLSHVDIGAQYIFRNESKQFRPYLGLAITGVANVFEILGEEIEFSGSGASLIFGGMYHFNKNLSFDFGINYGFLTYDTAKVNGETIDLGESDVLTARVKFGARYNF